MTQDAKARRGVIRRKRSTMMKKALVTMVVCAMLPCASAADRQGPRVGEHAAAQQIIHADAHTSVVVSGGHFTGQARVERLFPATPEIHASGAYVTFEPGAHSDWHTHPAGQRLVVTSGVGLVQEWGKPVQMVRAGDVVVCPPGIKHWHGAVPNSAMTHLAITGSVNGKSVTWMEDVTDEQYNAH